MDQVPVANRKKGAKNKRAWDQKNMQMHAKRDKNMDDPKSCIEGRGHVGVAWHYIEPYR